MNNKGFFEPLTFGLMALAMVFTLALFNLDKSAPECCWTVTKVQEHMNETGETLPVVYWYDGTEGLRTVGHDINDDGECDFEISYLYIQSYGVGLKPAHIYTCTEDN
jgi:hypothetical protein